MADEKANEKVDETVDTTETEETKSTEETIESTETEETKETTEETQETEETKETETDSEETSETSTDKETTVKSDDETTEDNILSEFIDEPEDKKSGTDKRIDKLTAKNYQLEAEVNALKGQQLANKPASEKTYTKDQLKTALGKAMSDQDHELMWDIMEQNTKQIVDKVKTEYEKEQNKLAETTKQNATEWTSVVDSYGYLSDAEEPEIYKGSRGELDINNPQSLLRQVALLLYGSKDEQLFQLYHVPGGQARAIADALNKIIVKRRGRSPDDKENKALKRKLGKERRKKSLTAKDSSIKEEKIIKPKRPLTDAETVLEAIEERKKPMEKLRASYKK